MSVLEPIGELARRLAAANALGAGRRVLLTQILADVDETYHLSARQLAKKYRVDPATVIRAARDLGYPGFAEFAHDLRAHFILNVTPYSTLIKVGALPAESLTEKLFSSEIANIRECSAALDVAALRRAADSIMAARRIVIAGLDLIDSIAQHLSYGLNLLGCAAIAPTQRTVLQYASRSVTDQDVVIAFGFRRTIRGAASAAIEARRNGALVIGITDYDDSVIARIADVSFVASVAGPAITSSLTAPLALVNALVNLCAESEHGLGKERLSAVHRDYHDGERWFTEDVNLIEATLPPKRSL